MKPRRVPGVVDHRAAHAAARVVRAERHRVGAGDDPGLGPVQVVRPGLVADPVGVRVPERPGVQGGHPPAGPGQPLRQHRAARPAAHDDQVDLVARRRTAACPGAAGGWSGCRRWASARRIRSARGPGSFVLLDRVARLAGRPAPRTAPAGPRPCSCTRAGRRARGSPSRSRPTGGRRTRCRRSGSTGSTPGLAGQPMPVTRAEVLHDLDQRRLIAGRAVGEAAPVLGLRVGVQEAQRVPPGLPVLGHIGITPAIGLRLGQPGVDHARSPGPAGGPGAGRRSARPARYADRGHAGRGAGRPAGWRWPPRPG